MDRAWPVMGQLNNLMTIKCSKKLTETVEGMLLLNSKVLMTTKHQHNNINNILPVLVMTIK